MRRALVAIAAAFLALAPLSAPVIARADAVPNAAINGYARGSAAYVPLSVNPNFDFWPVYSLSETDGSLSHGVSAGFWPGFLVDATFFEFGYQPFERAFMGVAESAYPIQPAEDEAGTSDFANDCAAGEKSKVPLPMGQGSAGAPEPLLTGCQALYTQYKSHVPWSVASARTGSDNLRSDGSALAAQLHFGTVTIGNAYTNSYTNGADHGRTESGATVVLSDVTVAGTLHFASIISSVRAIADGSAKDAKTERSLRIYDATYQGKPVEVGNDGVTTPDGKSVNDLLAKQGISVRVIDGSDKKTSTQSQVSSGALAVGLTRESSADPLGGADARCKQLASLQPTPVQTAQATLAPNPLYTNVPPYNQLPPNADVSTSLPPPIPCPFQLFERSVDTGIALAGATAVSRFQPLPPIPDFGGGDGGGVDFGGGFTGGGGGRHIGGGSGGSLLPDFNAVPPVSLKQLHRSAPLELGLAAAAKVKALYAGMALLIAGLIAGRRIFRYLIRP